MGVAQNCEIERADPRKHVRAHDYSDSGSSNQ